MPRYASRIRQCRPVATLVLLGSTFLFLADGAWAQFSPEDMLKQILPDTGQQSGDVEVAGERACQRYAESKGLDVRRVIETRRSGTNNIEVMLSVESRDSRHEARCVYDTDDREVRELQTMKDSAHARSRGKNDEVDKRVAQRARKACSELAKDRDLQNVDLDEVRARGRDTVEVAMHARNRGAFVCLYDDEQRQALFSE